MDQSRKAIGEPRPGNCSKMVAKIAMPSSMARRLRDRDLANKTPTLPPIAKLKTRMALAPGHNASPAT